MIRRQVKIFFSLRFKPNKTYLEFRDQGVLFLKLSTITPELLCRANSRLYFKSRPTPKPETGSGDRDASLAPFC